MQAQQIMQVQISEQSISRHKHSMAARCKQVVANSFSTSYMNILLLMCHHYLIVKSCFLKNNSKSLHIHSRKLEGNRRDGMSYTSRTCFLFPFLRNTNTVQFFPLVQTGQHQRMTQHITTQELQEAQDKFAMFLKICRSCPGLQHKYSIVQEPIFHLFHVICQEMHVCLSSL